MVWLTIINGAPYGVADLNIWRLKFILALSINKCIFNGASIIGTLRNEGKETYKMTPVCVSSVLGNFVVTKNGYYQLYYMTLSKHSLMLTRR